MDMPPVKGARTAPTTVRMIPAYFRNVLAGMPTTIHGPTFRMIFLRLFGSTFTTAACIFLGIDSIFRKTFLNHDFPSPDSHS